jgi:hypothetical protein
MTTTGNCIHHEHDSFKDKKYSIKETKSEYAQWIVKLPEYLKGFGEE